MQDIQSDESEQAPSEVRESALEMLRSHGCRVLSDIERMLGWERSIGMPDSQMAKKLGISTNQLRYLLFRKENQKKAKDQRIAKKGAKSIKFTTYVSNELKFKISFPVDWSICDAGIDTEIDESRLENIFTSFQKTFPDSEMTFYDFKRGIEENEKKISQYQNNEISEVGLVTFATTLSNSAHDPTVDVVKLKLARPMTAIELYEMDKPPWEHVPMGSRPNTAIDVDGLNGIKYYFVFNTGETSNITEMPKFFNVYFTERCEGWIISCSCVEESFINYKPIFERIIRSFERI